MATSLAPVRLAARSNLRRSLGAALAVGALLGLSGAVVLTAVAGARRTDTAFPRLLDATRAADVTLLATDGPVPIAVEDVRSLPGVRRAGLVDGYGLFAEGPDGRPDFNEAYYATAAADDVAYRQVARPLVVAGRSPTLDAADEVLISAHQGAEVGDHLVGYLFRFDEIAPVDEPTEADIQRLLQPVELRVVGLARFASDVVGAADQQGQAFAVFGPGFARAHPGRESYTQVVVDLADPVAGLGPLQQAIRERTGGGGVQFLDTATQTRAVTGSVSPYVGALAAFAAVLALAALFVLGPVAFRLGTGERAGLPVLRALGLRRRELAWVALAPPVFAAAVAAALSGTLAVAASGAFPVGPGRRAEPHPGVHADLAVILPGVVMVAAVVLVAGWLAASRAARRAGRQAPVAREGRRSIAGRLAGLGVPPAGLVGVRAAFEPRRTGGGTGAAVALAGPVGAVVAVTAALVFGATLGRFVSTPARYGWTWDALIETYESGASPEMIGDVRRDPDLAAVTVGGRGTVTLAGRSVPAVGLDPGPSPDAPGTPAARGPIPGLSEGRWPQQAGEVALAAGTMRALGAGVGDRVTASGADGQPVALSVVGRTVLPGLDPTQVYPLAEGAGFTPEGLENLAGYRPSFFLVDLLHGRSAATIETLTTRYDGAATVFSANPPGDVRSYDEVGGTPLLLAGIVAVLAAGVVANALFGSVRRRRRETVVLRALGFVRRQTVTAVVTESLALVGVGLAVGLPLGVVGGRLAWQRFANALGTGGDPVVPVDQLALLVAGAAALAALLSVAPARRASRLRPAAVLRAE